MDKNPEEMTDAEYLEYIKASAEAEGGMQATFAGPVTWQEVYDMAKVGVYFGR